MQAAAKNPACTAANSQGRSHAAGWLYTDRGSRVPMIPWWTSTYDTPRANGSHASYSATTGIMTKKWKCASISPSDRCTITPEQAIRPMAATVACSVRPIGR